MNPEEAYKTFTNLITAKEMLEIKSGKGGLSYYKNGVFVCHFNAKPQSKRDDLGFADFRYDALRPYLDIEKMIKALEKEAILKYKLRITNFGLLCIFH